MQHVDVLDQTLEVLSLEAQMPLNILILGGGTPFFGLLTLGVISTVSRGLLE